jgi:hypothetical protein
VEAETEDEATGAEDEEAEDEEAEDEEAEAQGTETEAEDADTRRRIAALEEKANQDSYVIAMLRCCDIVMLQCYRTKSLSSPQILNVLEVKVNTSICLSGNSNIFGTDFCFENSKCKGTESE